MNAPYLVDKNSTPPPNTPDWLISDSWVGSDTNSPTSSANPDSPMEQHITHSDFESPSDSDYEPVAGPSNPLPRTHSTHSTIKKKSFKPSSTGINLFIII
jgi:hypothetical protein